MLQQHKCFNNIDYVRKKQHEVSPITKQKQIYNKRSTISWNTTLCLYNFEPNLINVQKIMEYITNLLTCLLGCTKVKNARFSLQT